MPEDHIQTDSEAVFLHEVPAVIHAALQSMHRRYGLAEDPDLGNNDNLMPDKIYELSCMADSIKDLKGVLHLEKYDGNSQNIILKQTE